MENKSKDTEKIKKPEPKKPIIKPTIKPKTLISKKIKKT